MRVRVFKMRVFAHLSSGNSRSEEALKGPFLMGWMPGDFQEGKRPIKTFGETAH